MRTSLRLLAVGILLTGEDAERHPGRPTLRCRNPWKTRHFRVERHRVETGCAARAQARERRRPEYGGQTVGGNGLVRGNGQSQPSTRIWGWPAEPPYNGEIPYYCGGTTYVWGGSDAALSCSMNGGASGGPWLKDHIDANLGSVFAVTSRRTTSGTPTLLSTPNTPEVLAMFDQMTT